MLNRNSFLLIALVLFFTNNSSAQYAFSKRTHILVQKGSNVLKFPWTGGFNNPQFSGVDINNDGIKDLVVFDRTGNKTVTFINHGTAGTIDYVYSPYYEAAFEGFFQWMLMDDFDCDGVADVFTFFQGSADYYKGRYNQSNQIEFDFVTFFRLVSVGGGITNVFMGAPDISAIVDVNNDGDLDVLAFDQSGKKVGYFENQSQELTGTCGDTVLFKAYSGQWGNFLEQSNLEVTLDTTCGALRRGHRSSSMDGYHSLLAFDEDGDGDKELIMGSTFFENLNRMINCRTPDTACICDQDITYPPDKPYKLPYFPAAYYVDVNNDNLRDLIAAPNASGSQNYNCIWLYENAGTADSVVFHFVSDSFLVDQTLDFGEGAYPAFFDYNADGLLDLVVGNYGYYLSGGVYQPGLALLQNVGTSTAPAFKLIDRDYAHVSELGTRSTGVHPAFGDMDGDGDVDMIVGEIEGYLHFYRNTAGAGNPATFNLEMTRMFGIDVGRFSAPFIYDVNGDSLPDLIVGKQSGNGQLYISQVVYFENTGTPSDFIFSATPTNESFGRVDVRTPGDPNPAPNAYATPIISKLDSSETLYLLSGCDEGRIRVYEFNRDSIYTGSFKKMFSAYSSVDEGEKSSLAIADLNHDGKLEMVVGNYRGGVAFFSQSDTIYTEIVNEISEGNSFGARIYPNPAGNFIQLQLFNYNSPKISVELFDLAGRRIWTNMIDAQPVQLIKLPPVISGMYFVRLSNGSNSLMSKIFINQ